MASLATLAQESSRHLGPFRGLIWPGSYPASNCAENASFNLDKRPRVLYNPADSSHRRFFLLSTCDVEEAVCKRDQATLLINSAPASSANEVKHRRCNLFQRKLASPACVALVCKEGRCGSEKGAWMIRRKPLCSAHCSAGDGWSDTG